MAKSKVNVKIIKKMFLPNKAKNMRNTSLDFDL